MIVGLGGYATSGKDEFADAMMRHNPLWHKTYMSYSLEQALIVLDPFIPVLDPEEDYQLTRYSVLHKEVGYADSKKNPEVRRLLQVLGTQVGRNMFGDNVWVDKMLAIAKQNEFTIVTGVRYRNEIDAIIESGGVTAWVNRPGVVAINSHSSDNSLGPNDFTHFIENNGTLEKLAILAGKFSDFLTKDTQGA